tara:strand:+ start:143 stop:376 length:234 start_codon:yes stop_codon:yes gene_type:complete
MRERTTSEVEQPEVSNAQEMHSEVNEERKNNTKRLNLNDLLRRLNERKKADRKNHLLIIFSTTFVISVSALSVFYFI